MWALSICIVVHWEELYCDFLRKIRITKDFEGLYEVGIEQVQGVHRGQNRWKFCEKILCQVGI
jgi:hypothetical protein